MIVSTAEPKVPWDENVSQFSNDVEFEDRSRLSPTELEQCMIVMESLRRWREADRSLSEASQRYMRLNENDMRAVRMLIHAQQQNRFVTPKDIAHEIGISSASTTKLVDRLEAGGHLIRAPHPSDRRTVCIEVTAETAHAARETIGRQHARRFHAAAAMSSEDRDAVIRFLNALAEADIPQGHLAKPKP